MHMGRLQEALRRANFVRSAEFGRIGVISSLFAVTRHNCCAVLIGPPLCRLPEKQDGAHLIGGKATPRLAGRYMGPGGGGAKKPSSAREWEIAGRPAGPPFLRRDHRFETGRHASKGEGPVKYAR